MSFRLHTLKKRADFLRARNGRYFAAPGLVLQVLPSQSSRKQTDRAPVGADETLVRFGFTATKKLGNAVVRNRVKRRLRAAVRQIAPQKARTGYEYVLIGRASTLKRPFSSLLRDLTIAFAMVHAKRTRDKRGSSKTGHSKRQNH